MIVTATEVTGPAQTVGALLVGFAMCAAIAIGFTIIIWARELFADKREAAAEQARKDADAGRTFEHAYTPQVEDVAARDAALPSMPGVVVREPVLVKDAPGRLVAHREKYGA